MILIYIVCGNKKEADKIARAVLKKHLAACANIFPISSTYWWQGKLVSDKEVVLILKTIKKNFSKIKIEVKKLHSYQAPAIFSLAANQVDKKYNLWLRKNII